MAAELGVSASTVMRHGHAHGLKPHIVRGFKVSRDPKFVEKLEDIVGLYISPPSELRGRTRVTIEHPELLDDLKQVAAEAARTTWQAANEPATGELATLRAEARHAASAAEAERDARRDSRRARGGGGDRGPAGRSRTCMRIHAGGTGCLRQAHAATRARLDAGRAELEAAGRQLAELRTQYSTELSNVW